MSELNKRDLDRYITGDWGQDQFKCDSCGGDHADEDENFVCEGPPERDWDSERKARLEDG